MKSTDVRILEISGSQQPLAYRTPIKFGGRVVRAVTIVDVSVTVKTRDGRTGKGHGSMPMGATWAWPSSVVDDDAALEAMLIFAQQSTLMAAEYRNFGHPLEITHDLSRPYAELAAHIAEGRKLAEPIPKLAQLVASSPLHAAIHDAYGKALGANSYNLLGEEFCNADLATYLTPDFAGEYLDRYTLREPKPRLPLYHLVGALDPLTPGDVTTPIGDGLPETLGEWIARDGLTHLKIKLNGDDLAWDVSRVAAVHKVTVEQVAAKEIAEAQAKRNCPAWHYSLDFNERCENVDYVLDFLGQLRDRAPAALDRVQYIEQPTHRDLVAHPENKMHKAAAIKPVVIDESLVDLASLQLARELGYSGVALKACKGHSDALLMGAAAQKFGMFLCVQDLTCPGLSFLHSASLAARIPTVAAIEGNARQYCPAGNAGWSEKYPGMFRITDGTLETSVLTEPGLGYSP
jgi:L-alanine-DL-glutamate epimerase-like enolase superfamily enzyme